MPGARCARSRVCEGRKQKSTRVCQVTPESPGIPHAMVLTASFALFPATGFLATVIPERLASQELDASIGASEPHDFSVRFSAVRYQRFHVHRILTRVRDDREPPLCGAGRRKYATDLGEAKTEIFLNGRLDRRPSQDDLICPSGKLPMPKNHSRRPCERGKDAGNLNHRRPGQAKREPGPIRRVACCETRCWTTLPNH